MSVLVFIEINNKLSKSALEAITYGKSLGQVSVLTYGEIAEDLLLETANYGAEKVLVCRTLKERKEQVLSKLILKAVNETNAEYVVLSQDQTGKAIGPRVAANLEAGHVSGARSFRRVYC